jgi:hypothetical protein
MYKQLLFAAFIGLAIAAGALLPISNQASNFHTKAELELLRMILDGPIDSSIIFPVASTCSGCHGYDSSGNALVDFFGNDVNMHDQWSATLMANSAKDPFWRAKVSHEILANPAFSQKIETKCTSCHAPMGHYTAILRGHEHYTIADMLADPVGLDGVSCSACHKISEEQLGQLHSGHINFDTNRVVYGPYFLPFEAPMAEFVGMTPVFGKHISDAGLCASCHTLITESIGTDGQFTGTTFVEQATYHEWLNSAYEEQEVSCQACHMPRLEEPVVISSGYLFLEARSPYGMHTMAGANTFMLQLMKEYRQELGLSAAPEHFDRSIAATFDMLQNQSLHTQLDWLGVQGDTAYFQLKLANRAGHKLPSGYPARRMFVEFMVRTTTGDTLFHSGRFNSNYELVDENPGVEPHHHIINRPDQVQIYEMAAGSQAGDFTVLLMNAHTMLKDNRLPPLGFSAAHPVYDTTRIVGSALSDPDFNYANGQEGSGGDVLHFHIPTQAYAGPVEVSARVYYHALPPKWLAPIFTVSSPEIESFHQMFQSMDNAPVLMAERRLEAEFPLPNTTRSAALRDARLFPNPTADGIVHLVLPAGVRLLETHLYDAQGRLVRRWAGSLDSIALPKPGLYFLRMATSQGEWTERVVGSW